MKRNGFTLIELLAVIVILAIIALIATPIILGIIKDNKEKAALISVENYLRAVENAITKETMKNPNTNYDGKYKIISDGKSIHSLEKGDITVEYNGEGLKSGTIIIGDGKVKESGLLKVDNINIKVNSGQTSVIDNIEKSYLIRGSTFNSKIKTLVNGSSFSYSDRDSLIKKIEFLSLGMIPQGYTKETLQQLPNIDVSDKSDKSIVAYLDNDKIYVFSENLISFNDSSGAMFQDLINVESIEFGDISTNSVTSMWHMFYRCVNLTSLDVSNFNTSKVEDMSEMFWFCRRLKMLDLSNFDTSQVNDMGYMFSYCYDLKSLDLSNFDTSKVTDMRYMFKECSSLKKLNVSNWDTSKVTSMEAMFQQCYSLTKLDLRSWDTSKVTGMVYMFLSTPNLKPIYVGEKWVIPYSNDSSVFDGSKTENREQLCEPGSTESWCIVSS